MIEGGRQIKRKKRLGKYPAVSLAQARRLAAEVAEAVEKGRDPVAEEHAQRAQRERDGLTLADLIADYIEDQTRSGVATVREVERALNRDIVPALGHLRPAEITDLQIEAVIDGVAKRGKAMARHLLVYLRGVYNHALRGSPQLRHRYGLTHNPADISELHLTGREPKWLLPAERTKNGLPHLVPLSAFWSIPS